MTRAPIGLDRSAEGALQVSPGQRPGSMYPNSGALKGRPNRGHRTGLVLARGVCDGYAALAGLDVSFCYPGRCPGLTYYTLSGRPSEGELARSEIGPFDKLRPRFPLFGQILS